MTRRQLDVIHAEVDVRVVKLDAEGAIQFNRVDGSIQTGITGSGSGGNVEGPRGHASGSVRQEEITFRRAGRKGEVAAHEHAAGGVVGLQGEDRAA